MSTAPALRGPAAAQRPEAAAAPALEPPFAIVLSAFNGGPWLEAQLESIRAQTATNWRLYARDDGSADDTAGKLREWAARDPRIEVLPFDGRNLGAAASFGVLLQHALDRGERYVFMSDQDDVWLSEKCSTLLAIMRDEEARVGPDVPLLVHSDLHVVDQELSGMHPSFVGLQRIDGAEEHRARRLLVGNSVTGCAALVNAALLRCALPMPAVAMHDWWLAQCAGAFGEVLFLHVPTVLYRQHGKNVVGASGLLERAGVVLRSPRAWWQASARRFLQGLHQVWVLRARARARGLKVVPHVQRSVDVFWEGLGEDRGLAARLGAAWRSRALPRSAPMKGLFLARVALLSRLRARFGDERAGVAEAAGPGAAGPLVDFTCNVCGGRNVGVPLAHAENRECQSCRHCTASLRMRSLVYLLSMELFGRPMALPEFPVDKGIRGLGMSDWEGYARALAQKFDYTNTFYHQEPRLDIADIPEALAGRHRFLISSDVFEHIPPAALDAAFRNSRRLLRDDGFFLFTVPFAKQGETREHFPRLHEFRIVEADGKRVLCNRTADGEEEVYEDLVFHGGEGMTLEMRMFSEADLLRRLAAAGFSSARVHGEHHPEYGVLWPIDHSLPIVARA